MSAAYFAPQTLDEALDVMCHHAPQIVAGGTDYFPARGAQPQRRNLLDVTRIAGLRGISRDGAGWRMGAVTTWSDIVAADLPPAFDALKAAAREVGSIQIQNAGTVAGNLCNASPAADGVPPLLTLNAEVELASGTGARRMALSDFLKGPRQTALTEGEMMVALHIPGVPEGARSAFEKLGARKYLVISIAMTAVLVDVDAGGLIREARVAVGSCGPVALRLTALEASLTGQPAQTAVVDAEHLLPLSPISDVRADAGYRRDMVAHQISRAIAKAVTHG